MDPKIELSRNCIESVIQSFDSKTGPFEKFPYNSPADILCQCGFEPDVNQDEFRRAFSVMRIAQGARRSVSVADHDLIQHVTSALANWKARIKGADLMRPIQYRKGNPNLSFVVMQMERLRTAVHFRMHEYDRYKGKLTFSAQALVLGDLDVVFHVSLPTSFFGQSYLSVQFPFYNYETEPCNITGGGILGADALGSLGLLPFVELFAPDLLLWDMWSRGGDFSKLSIFIDFVIACISCMDENLIRKNDGCA